MIKISDSDDDDDDDYDNTNNWWRTRNLHGVQSSLECLYCRCIRNPNRFILFVLILLKYSRSSPISGFSCDYVYLIRALLDLYDATMDQQWLQWAVELQNKTDELFWDDKNGGYFAIAEGDPSILIRMKDGE